VAVAAPLYTWTGCYLGGNLGYHRSSYDQKLSFDDNPPSPGPVEHIFTDHLLAAGAIGGYQVGCQVQTGHYVWGVEHDYAWTGGSDNRFYAPDPADADSPAFSAKTKSVLTVRGRFGYAEGDTFIYATAGWAGAKLNYSYILNDVDAGVSAGSLDFTTNGLVVGVGAEYRFAGNWVAGLEWLHYSFGTDQLLPSVPTIGPWGAGGDHINLRTMDVVRGRLSRIGLRASRLQITNTTRISKEPRGNRGSACFPASRANPGDPGRALPIWSRTAPRGCRICS
jgi:outer membrane immunogenic protein